VAAPAPGKTPAAPAKAPRVKTYIDP
jgi:hypothetical protein